MTKNVVCDTGLDPDPEKNSFILFSIKGIIGKITIGL